MAARLEPLGDDRIEHDRLGQRRGARAGPRTGLGGAHAIGDPSLIDTANRVFTDAMGVGLMAAVAATVIGAILVAVKLPDRRKTLAAAPVAS